MTSKPEVATVEPQIAHADGMFALDSAKANIQYRAAMVARPVFLYLAANAATAKHDGKAYGNSTEKTHPYNAAKQYTWSPALPSHALARDTGNAYPPAYDGVKCWTTPTYQPLVAFAHHVFALAASHGSAFTYADLIGSKAARKRLAEYMDSNGKLNSKAAKCLADTLADMVAFSFAFASDGNMNAKTLFTFNVNHGKVEVANEWPQIK